jgi:hypothetical protein
MTLRQLSINGPTANPFAGGPRLALRLQLIACHALRFRGLLMDSLAVPGSRRGTGDSAGASFLFTIDTLSERLHDVHDRRHRLRSRTGRRDLAVCHLGRNQSLQFLPMGIFELFRCKLAGDRSHKGFREFELFRCSTSEALTSNSFPARISS